MNTSTAHLIYLIYTPTHANSNPFQPNLTPSNPSTLLHTTSYVNGQSMQTMLENMETSIATKFYSSVGGSGGSHAKEVDDQVTLLSFPYNPLSQFSTLPLNTTLPPNGTLPLSTRLSLSILDPPSHLYLFSQHLPLPLPTFPLLFLPSHLSSQYLPSLALALDP